MEDRQCKMSRLLVFDAGIERLSVPQRNSRVSLGEPTLFADIFRLVVG